MPDRVQLYPQPGLAAIDFAFPREIDLAYDPTNFPRLSYSVAGRDPRPYAGYPLVVNYDDRTEIARIGTPFARTARLAYDLTTEVDATPVFANFEVYTLPIARRCRFAMQGEDLSLLTPCRDENGNIRTVPNFVLDAPPHILYEDNVSEGIYWGNKADLDRVRGIYVLTAPGQTDSDNFTQPLIPDHFTSGHPTFVPPTDSETGTFQCFSRFIEPKVTGGFVETVTQGANAISVTVPDLPAKTVVTGILQGLPFGSDDANNKLTMDGDVWLVDSADQLERNRYEVVLEKREP